MWCLVSLRLVTGDSDVTQAMPSPIGEGHSFMMSQKRDGHLGYDLTRIINLAKIASLKLQELSSPRRMGKPSQTREIKNVCVYSMYRHKEIFPRPNGASRG